MRKKQLWKQYAGAIALLVVPVLGKADVVLDWNATMQAVVSTPGGGNVSSPRET
jgi:hypothetical protein